MYCILSEYLLSVLFFSHHFISGLLSLITRIHLLSEKRAGRRKRKTKTEKGKLENGEVIWNTLCMSFKRIIYWVNFHSCNSSESPSPSPQREKKKDKKKKKKRFHLMSLNYNILFIHTGIRCINWEKSKHLNIFSLFITWVTLEYVNHKMDTFLLK